MEERDFKDALRPPQMIRTPIYRGYTEANKKEHANLRVLNSVINRGWPRSPELGHHIAKPN